MNQMSTNMVHSIFILQGSPHRSLQLNQGLEILSHNNQLFVFFKKLSNIYSGTYPISEFIQIGSRSTSFLAPFTNRAIAGSWCLVTSQHLLPQYMIMNHICYPHQQNNALSFAQLLDQKRKEKSFAQLSNGLLLQGAKFVKAFLKAQTTYSIGVQLLLKKGERFRNMNIATQQKEATVTTVCKKHVWQKLLLPQCVEVKMALLTMVRSRKITTSFHTYKSYKVSLCT